MPWQISERTLLNCATPLYRSNAKLMYLLAIDILGGPCTPIYLLTLILPY